MDKLIEWMISHEAMTGVLIASAFVVVMLGAIIVVAFLQGREVSLWPPRVGQKPVGLNHVQYARSTEANGRVAAPVEVEPAVPIKQKQPDAAFMQASYPRSQHPEFYSAVEHLASRAKRITLAATGLNLIWQKNILDMLVDRAQKGETEVTICLGNPFSPHVEDRLVEEEMRDNRAPVGRSGIINNALALVERLEKAGNPLNFKVLLFEHYPTIATLVFDDDIFLYPYAYGTLGNLSPMFHLHNDGGEVSSFFLRNLERVVTDAVPAHDVLHHRRMSGYSSPSWTAAAVFAIPDESDPLYIMGSSVLNYDIRHMSEVASPQFAMLEKYVGDARSFGFHLTLADALYFATESAVDRVEAEVRTLAKEFPSFVLSGLRVVDGIDERGDVVLVCDDESGITEALHHEMVSRVYPMAISSYYISGGAGEAIRNVGSRDGLMMRRYGAPFILNRFIPHFTLLADPPSRSDELSSIVSLLAATLKQNSIEQVHINELALVTRNSGESCWRLRERFPLSRA